jgi:hypothetical protein
MATNPSVTEKLLFMNDKDESKSIHKNYKDNYFVYPFFFVPLGAHTPIPASWKSLLGFLYQIFAPSTWFSSWGRERSLKQNVI